MADENVGVQASGCEAVNRRIAKRTWSKGDVLLGAERLSELNLLAATKGGKCLSDIYLGVMKPHRWQCAYGHVWSTKPNAIKNGRWCPECCRRGSSLGERTTRIILESMFGVPFRKCRPSWLRRDKGRALELDGYAESLGIAFEYQGPQHFAAGGFFTHSAVCEQRERDAEKARLCKAQGVKLLIVREFPHKSDMMSMCDQVAAVVVAHGLPVPPGWKRPSDTSYVVDPLVHVFGESGTMDLRRMAADRGGELVSTTIALANDPLVWRCSKGHQWSARVGNIKKGRWCPYCSGRLGHGLDGLRDLAASRGGQCLATEYVNSKKKVEWLCRLGHRFEADAGTIKAGTWCPQCRGSAISETKLASGKVRGFSIERMREIAAERGGECLSPEYLGTLKHLEWKCSEGHVWRAVPGTIIGRGSWCRRCYHDKRMRREASKA